MLSAGDTVLIYAKGDEVVIDETGEIIGDSIATLQVVSVDTKFANAQALSGFQNIEKGQEGYLLITDG